MSPRNTTGLSVGVSTGAVPKVRGRLRTQAGTATQGRGAGEGAEPAGTATDDEPSADAGRPAEGLRCRHRAQRQGPHHLLELHQRRSRHRWPSKSRRWSWADVAAQTMTLVRKAGWRRSEATGVFKRLQKIQKPSRPPPVFRPEPGARRRARYAPWRPESTWPTSRPDRRE